jgi:hypothetical protein
MTRWCASESCMTDAEIMRQNARFRSSWEPEPASGGDLITLRVVAAAAVVNGVIGHCRPSKIKLDWRQLTIKVKHLGSLNSTPLQYSMVLRVSCIPDSGKSGMGMGVDPRSPANRGWDPHPRSPANRGWGWGWGSGVPCPGPEHGRVILVLSAPNLVSDWSPGQHRPDAP